MTLQLRASGVDMKLAKPHRRNDVLIDGGTTNTYFEDNVHGISRLEQKQKQLVVI